MYSLRDDVSEDEINRYYDNYETVEYNGDGDFYRLYFYIKKSIRDSHRIFIYMMEINRFLQRHTLNEHIANRYNRDFFFSGFQLQEAVDLSKFSEEAILDLMLISYKIYDILLLCICTLNLYITDRENNHYVCYRISRFDDYTVYLDKMNIFA